MFSDTRPLEEPTTLWMHPVPTFRVIPSDFNPKLYVVNEPDPHVTFVVESINALRLEDMVTRLAIDFYSRYSLGEGAFEAADWLKDHMTALGCQNARTEQFRPNYSPNVICELPGVDKDEPSVWIGAHYDSIPSSGPAPGADDNASGSAGTLEILRAMYNLTQTGVSFKRTVHFALFGGEEQGLLGSRDVATKLFNNGAQLRGYVNLDMVGFPDRNNPTTMWWLRDSVNRDLTNLGISLTRTYLGEETDIREMSGCCTDSRSFHERGFASACVFESSSPFNNPNYHRNTDLPATLDYNHAMRTTQMAAALAATLAEQRKNKF